MFLNLDIILDVKEQLNGKAKSGGDNHEQVFMNYGKNSEYDQEIPQSKTPDKPVAS